MKRLVYFVFLLISIEGYTQSRYLVIFNNKNISKSDLALSQNSIERKLRYNIPIDSRDYGIENDKLGKIKSICNIEKVSNWLNSIVVSIDNEEQLESIKKLEFVKNIQFIGSVNVPSFKSSKEEAYTIEEYGDSYNQIKIHNGDYLHDRGFEGQGVKIAVFDAGYKNLNTISSFTHLFQENRIHFGSNEVYNNTELYDYSSHGTNVVGCMASFFKDSIVATAIKADYFLFVTEDSRSESKIEEVNWAIAAQKADSIGVDIINSSLGYTRFDDESTNYSHADMDGNTAISTQAANIATEKGIIVVNSAGNSGKNDWRYIGAPADGHDVISLGAIDKNQIVTDFSSRGFSTFNIVKPTVMAMGRDAVCYYDKGKYITGNGTSFSSPIMTGLIASFWSMNRNITPAEIRFLIPFISDNYLTPSIEYGYGVPDFNQIEEKVKVLNQLESDKFIVYPIPSSTYTNIVFMIDNINEDYTITVNSYNELLVEEKMVVKEGINRLKLNLDVYSSGMYFLKIYKGREVLYQSRFLVAK